MESSCYGKPCWWDLSALTACLAFSLGGVVQPASAATRLVPADYPTIQAAIDAAVLGDTVLVSSGTYQGVGNRGIEFRGKDLVVKSSQGPAQTIIDCQDLGRGLYLHEFETPAARLEGFTVRNGYADYSSPWGSAGGGILSVLSWVTIANCRIERCWSTSDGGGLYLILGGSVDGCVFFDNYAVGRGGGIYIDTQTGSITNCVIEENGSLLGGGICFGGGGQYSLSGCTVAGNFCYGGGGGGIYATGHLLLEQCIIWGNCSMVEGDEIRCGYAEFRCSDIDRSGVESNVEVTYDEYCIDADPLFCDGRPCGAHAEGDWSLNLNSPCLAQNSPCGVLIGALDAGCGFPTPEGACCLTGEVCVVVSEESCTSQQGSYQGNGTLCTPESCLPTAVERTSWGRIKGAFR